ncbi:MAG: ABC transporter substrate-binding protein [Bryobacteraceae bacterium]|jgi:peptide/nickel transport system substrate-binding protein
MRLIAFISIVPVSLVLAAGTAAARPRYGGTLRLELRAIVRNLDPADVAIDPLEGAAKANVLSQVFETLVRLDEKGRPQPLLAENWTHDAEHRRWIFRARQHVTFHNGAPWSPAGSELYYPDDRPIEQILRDLALLKNAIVLRLNDGAIYGTGPFNVLRFEPDKSIVLAAHEQHWAGRPYIDAIEIRMGRAFRDQAQDAQLGQADVTELPATEVRRARQRGDAVALSLPLETLALLFDRAREAPPAVREALALAVDRASIQDVLLQKLGEASAALLPQWLSGHALAFTAERNVARARHLNPGAIVLRFSYDRQDPVLRGVAERIALNAAECAIALRADAAAPAVRLAWLRIIQPDPDLALNEIAATLGIALAPAPDPFERESALLDRYYVVPVAQLGVAHALSPRAQGWLGAPWVASDRWDLANVWLGEAAP